MSGHYYIEGQRIVSKLGSGLDNNGKGQLKAGQDKVNYGKKQADIREGIVKNLKFLGIDGAILTAGNSGKTPPGQLKGGKGGSAGGGKDKASEKFQYFYHPDHLGSSSYITDASGEVYQHLEYFAFGETFVEEHSNTHRTPYLFNGKELDEETGLYYYGARYYDAKISMFYGVDPLTEQYIFQSPYAYAANNPVKFVDILGMGPGPGNPYCTDNPLYVAAEGFRQYFQAVGTAIDKAYVSVSVTSSTLLKEAKFKLGIAEGSIKSTVDVNNTTTVRTNLGEFFQNVNNKPGGPAIKVENKTTITQSTKVEANATIEGVDINVQNKSDIDLSNGNTSNTTEVTAGKNKSGLFISHKETSTSSKTDIGLKGNVSQKTGNTTFTFTIKAGATVNEQ